ncbi:uncharacterized protein [Amphiura filiformis]|uniref:uncharacterized protein n=1 Tax=Amphiura filiformis TaxID=82378 RepID=UPI003B224813
MSFSGSELKDWGISPTYPSLDDGRHNEEKKDKIFIDAARRPPPQRKKIKRKEVNVHERSQEPSKEPFPKKHKKSTKSTIRRCKTCDKTFSNIDEVKIHEIDKHLPGIGAQESKHLHESDKDKAQEVKETEEVKKVDEAEKVEEAEAESHADGSKNDAVQSITGKTYMLNQDEELPPVEESVMSVKCSLADASDHASSGLTSTKAADITKVVHLANKITTNSQEAAESGMASYNESTHSDKDVEEEEDLTGTVNLSSEKTEVFGGIQNVVLLQFKDLLERSQKRWIEQQVSESQVVKCLQANCKKLNLAFHGKTPADGNCFFNAVSDQLHLFNLPHQSPWNLRQSVVEFLRNNPSIQGPDGTINFEAIHPDWETYCTSMARDGEWADHIVIVAIAHILQRDILIVTSSPQGADGADPFIRISSGTDGPSIQPLLLGHLWESHYQSLMKIEVFPMTSEKETHSPDQVQPRKASRKEDYSPMASERETYSQDQVEPLQHVQASGEKESPFDLEWEDEVPEEGDDDDEPQIKLRQELRDDCDKLKENPNHHKQYLSLEEILEVCQGTRDHEYAELIRDIGEENLIAIASSAVLIRVVKKKKGKPPTISYGTGFVTGKPPQSAPEGCLPIMTANHVLLSNKLAKADDVSVIFFHDGMNHVLVCNVVAIDKQQSPPMRQDKPHDFKNLDYALLYIDIEEIVDKMTLRLFQELYREEVEQFPQMERKKVALKVFEKLRSEDSYVSQVAVKHFTQYQFILKIFPVLLGDTTAWLQLAQQTTDKGVPLLCVGHPHGAPKQFSFSLLEADTSKLFTEMKSSNQRVSIKHSCCTCAGSSGSPIIAIHHKTKFSISRLQSSGMLHVHFVHTSARSAVTIHGITHDVTKTNDKHTKLKESFVGNTYAILDILTHNDYSVDQTTYKEIRDVVSNLKTNLNKKLEKHIKLDSPRLHDMFHELLIPIKQNSPVPLSNNLLALGVPNIEQTKHHLQDLTQLLDQSSIHIPLDRNRCKQKVFYLRRALKYNFNKDLIELMIPDGITILMTLLSSVICNRESEVDYQGALIFMILQIIVWTADKQHGATEEVCRSLIKAGFLGQMIHIHEFIFINRNSINAQELEIQGERIIINILKLFISTIVTCHEQISSSDKSKLLILLVKQLSDDVLKQQATVLITLMLVNDSELLPVAIEAGCHRTVYLCPLMNKLESVQNYPTEKEHVMVSSMICILRVVELLIQGTEKSGHIDETCRSLVEAGFIAQLLCMYENPTLYPTKHIDTNTEEMQESGKVAVDEQPHVDPDVEQIQSMLSTILIKILHTCWRQVSSSDKSKLLKLLVKQLSDGNLEEAVSITRMLWLANENLDSELLPVAIEAGCHRTVYLCPLMNKLESVLNDPTMHGLEVYMVYIILTAVRLLIEGTKKFGYIDEACRSLIEAGFIAQLLCMYESPLLYPNEHNDMNTKEMQESGKVTLDEQTQVDPNVKKKILFIPTNILIDILNTCCDQVSISDKSKLLELLVRHLSDDNLKVGATISITNILIKEDVNSELLHVAIQAGCHRSPYINTLLDLIESSTENLSAEHPTSYANLCAFLRVANLLLKTAGAIASQSFIDAGFIAQLLCMYENRLLYPKKHNDRNTKEIQESCKVTLDSQTQIEHVGKIQSMATDILIYIIYTCCDQVSISDKSKLLDLFVKHLPDDNLKNGVTYSITNILIKEDVNSELLHVAIEAGCHRSPYINPLLDLLVSNTEHLSAGEPHSYTNICSILRVVNLLLTAIEPHTTAGGIASQSFIDAGLVNKILLMYKNPILYPNKDIITTDQTEVSSAINANFTKFSEVEKIQTLISCTVALSFCKCYTGISMQEMKTLLDSRLLNLFRYMLTKGMNDKIKHNSSLAIAYIMLQITFQRDDSASEIAALAVETNCIQPRFFSTILNLSSTEHFTLITNLIVGAKQIGCLNKLCKALWEADDKEKYFLLLCITVVLVASQICNEKSSSETYRLRIC